MLGLPINYHIQKFIISKKVEQLVECLKFPILIIFFLHLDEGEEETG